MWMADDQQKFQEMLATMKKQSSRLTLNDKTIENKLTLGEFTLHGNQSNFQISTSIAE